MVKSDFVPEIMMEQHGTCCLITDYNAERLVKMYNNKKQKKMDQVRGIV